MDIPENSEFGKNNKKERPLRDVGLKLAVILHFAPIGTVWYPNFQEPKIQLSPKVAKIHCPIDKRTVEEYKKIYMRKL